MLTPSAVAAGHPATTDVGVRLLRMGGTAADAAVGAMLAACASETIFTGLSGGGFATYFEAATGKVTCLDFFCAAPGLDGDVKPGPMRPVNIRFGQVPVPYEIGGASVAVPGVPAGAGAIHDRWGRLAWEDVIAPARELARHGVPIPAAQARTLPMLVEAMLLDQGGPAYAPGGELLRGGDRLYHAGLADALNELAEHGPDALYKGRLGHLLVDVVRADGGCLGPADLALYQVKELPVRRAEIAGVTILGRDDLNRTVATLRTLPSDLASMTPPLRAVALAKALRNVVYDGLGDTTNITAVDASGNACVITTTLGLGAGLWLPGYGVHLNSMLGEGELMTGEPAPGERIASMMCPLVAVDADGSLVLAIGSAGASRIRSALMRTLIGVLVDGMSVPEAVNAPRLHAVGDLAHVEPEFPVEDAEALEDNGFEVNRWTERNHYFGGVSAVGVGGYSGDPRRDGFASPAVVSA